MKTNYTITAGTHPNSIEVYFDSKPALDVIDALKALRFRWNHKKACWYGFENERTIVDTLIAHGMGENIDGEEVEGATVYTDGYLGGGAVYGSKSYRHLYGSDLSKAIREDIKSAGIKDVSVKCGKSTNTDKINITVTVTAADLVPLDEYIAAYEVRPTFNWIYLDNGEGNTPEDMHIDKYFDATAEEQAEIRRRAATYEHRRALTTEQNINHYHMDKYREYSPEFMSKLERIREIVTAYHWDESNSMVDYFSTNFYWNICTKPAKA